MCSPIVLASSSTTSVERCLYSTWKLSIRDCRSTMCREGWTGQKAGLDEDGGEEDDGADADVDAEEGGAKGTGAVASDWLWGP